MLRGQGWEGGGGGRREEGGGRREEGGGRREEFIGSSNWRGKHNSLCRGEEEEEEEFLWNRTRARRNS
jgi:hypothetical protein